MIEQVRAALAAKHDSKLVAELLDAYQDAKTQYYQGGRRLQAVEGGRFCEAAFRLLEQETTSTFTPLGRQLDTDGLIRKLAQLPAGDHADSIRLHIPRTLRVVYDIRNKRDAAHLADGIDPNRQDATLVVACIDWVLAELLRLWNDLEADQAHRIVEDLVSRRAPVIQDLDGFLKVLDPDLSRGQHVLLLLYHCGSAGATMDQLRTWVKPSMRRHLSMVVRRMQHEQNYVHSDGERAVITERGIVYIEQSGILIPT